MYGAYGMMLSLFRFYLRIRRRVTRALPEGVGDIIGIFAHFNFLRLIPTCLAVLLIPDHFFRRFDRVIKGKFKLFSSPAQCVLQLAALVAAVGLTRGVHLDERIVVVALLVFGVTSPVWSYILLMIVSFAFSRFNSSWAQAFVEDKLDMSWANPGLREMLSFAGLANLNWNRYLQGSILFSIYSIFALPLAIIPGAFLALLGLLLDRHIRETDPTSDMSNSPARFVYSAAFLFIAYGIGWMLMRPLAFLLVFCSKHPHRTILQYEMLKLKKRFEKVFFGEPTMDLRNASGRNTQPVKRELAILLGRWGLTERATARKCPEYLSDLLYERKEIAEDLLQYRIYLDQDADIPLLDKLNRIERGELLVSTVEVRTSEMS